MAETALTVNESSETELDYGANLEDADTVNNNSAANVNGDLMLLMENPGASSATVTITAQNSPKSIQGHGPLTKADKVVSLAAGEEKMIGPLNAAMWNDGNNNIILTAGGAGAADVNYYAFRGPKV